GVGRRPPGRWIGGPRQSKVARRSPPPSGVGSPGGAAGGPMPASPPALLPALRAVVGDAHVLADAGMRAGFETDWTRRWHGDSICVVRPGSVEEVAGVIRACAAAGAV